MGLYIGKIKVTPTVSSPPNDKELIKMIEKTYSVNSGQVPLSDKEIETIFKQVVFANKILWGGSY